MDQHVESILFTCSMGELVFTAVCLVIGLGLIFARDLSKFDKFLAYFLIAVLVLTIVMILIMVLLRHHDRKHILTAVLLVFFDVAVLAAGVFQLTSRPQSITLSSIKDGWSQPEYAEAVRAYEARHMCCGMAETAGINCSFQTNQSCAESWSSEVRRACDAIGAGLIGLAGINLPRVVLAFLFVRCDPKTHKELPTYDSDQQERELEDCDSSAIADEL